MPLWGAADLAYCANVHPGTTAAIIEDNLQRVTSAVRQRLQLPSMHAGLWLCEHALAEYREPAAQQRLRDVLLKEKLAVVTCNGFPQKDFHQPVVKDSVYQPSWADPARLRYTEELATLLAALLPASVAEGSISTLPLGYRTFWSVDAQRQASEHLFDYVDFAARLEQASGKRIRLCLEMEPGCVLENTSQSIAFFNKYLKDFARLQGRDFAGAARYLGVCLDVCHQAVMQENIADSMRALTDAGIAIGKIQISSALVARHVDEAGVQQALGQFAEPKYLHQTSVVHGDGRRQFFDDLPQALADERALRAQQWTVHFHLPIQLQSLDIAQTSHLSTTQSHIVDCLQALRLLPNRPHLEVETYTWHVLPQFHTSADWLVEGLSVELRWLQQAMTTLGMLAP